MAKTYVNTVKYLIQVDFEIKGVVDKPDIIGAIFGQSEGLLGEEMDLRELQKNGRIGRIEIKYKTQQGVTKGNVLVPSSMDMVETSILAAAIETVEKVGPCEASFKTRGIEDTRALKRKELTERAQTLLRNFISTQIPDVQELAEKVREEVRAAEVQSFGREKIACGPAIWEDDSIIIVEGRADVLNLLRNGVKNVIAMGGSKIPKVIVDLTRKKTVTLFVDGDRGGELNIRKMAQIGDIDYIARAPEGKEVEELARKEIIMALRRKAPAAQAGKPEIIAKPSFKQAVKPVALAKPAGFRTRGPTRTPRGRSGRPVRGRKPFRPAVQPEVKEEPKEIISEEDRKVFEPIMAELKGSLKARLFDAKMKVVEEVPVRELLKSLDKKKKIQTIVFDGIVTKRVIEEAKKAGIKTVAGVKKGSLAEEKDVKIIVLN